MQIFSSMIMLSCFGLEISSWLTNNVSKQKAAADAAAEENMQWNDRMNYYEFGNH